MGYLTNKVRSLLGSRDTPWPVILGDTNRAFHGDRCYQQLVLSICSQWPISSFVETGTYVGDTTEYMARTFSFPIYSCEVKDAYFHSSSKRLKGFSHVKMIHASSEQALRQIIDQNLVGPLPLFYLDAHWYDYWPLVDEIGLIVSRVPRCVVVIDDFQVPGSSDFTFCEGGGGSPEFSGRATVDKRICNLELIRGKLCQPAEYRLLHPRYSRQEAFGVSSSENLIGYVVLFRNLVPELPALTKQQFINDHFECVNLDR